jgi:hypothetical protein
MKVVEKPTQRGMRGVKEFLMKVQLSRELETLDTVGQRSDLGKQLFDFNTG